MLTLPANFQTVLKKTEQLEYRAIVKLGRSLVASPYTASHYYLTTHKDSTVYEITDSGTSYPLLSVLKDIPGIDEKINITRLEATVGGFTLEIINTTYDKFADDFILYNIYNRSVEIYIWLEGLTDIADCLKIYEGVARDVKSNTDRVSISVENIQSNIHLEIPLNAVSESDAPTGYVLPSQSSGKPKPVVFGDRRFKINSNQTNQLNKSDWTASRVNSLSPCIPLGGRQYLVADHEVNALTFATPDTIWCYDSRIGRYVEMVTWSVIQNTSAGCIIQRDDDLFHDFRAPSAIADDGAADRPWINESNLIDNDVSTLSQGKLYAGDPNGRTSGCIIDFPANDIEEDIINEIKLLMLCDGDFNDAKARLYVEGATGDIFVNNTQTNYFQKHNNPILFANIEQLALTYEAVAVVAADITADCYACYLRVEYIREDEMPVFFGGRGKEYSGTWGTRKTSGNLIEQPTDFIEAILRDLLGLSSEINTTTFDALADSATGELKDWLAALTLDTFNNSRTICEKVAFETNSIFRVDSLNTVSIDTFFASNSTDLVISKHDVKSVDIDKISLADMCNDLKLTYGKDYQDGQPQVPLNRVDDRANVGSQAITGEVIEKPITNDIIYDTTTAGLYADHYTKDDDDSFWSVVRNILTLDLSRILGRNFWQGGSFVPLVGIELTDIIEIEDFALNFQPNMSQSVNVGTDASIQPALPISIEIWVKFDSTVIGSGCVLFANDDQSNFSGVWVAKDSSDKILAVYGDNTGTGSSDRRRKIAATALSSGEWYHILIVVQGATDMQIYINGTDDNGAYDGSGGALAYGADLDGIIGRRTGVSSAGGFRIAQIGFWDVALSAADAAILAEDVKDLTLVASYDTDRTGDLQGFWRMDYESGTFVRDLSGNGNNGTTQNSPEWIDKFIDRLFGKSWHRKQFKVSSFNRNTLKLGAFEL